MGVSTQSTWGPANNTNFTLITRSISFITHIPQIRVFVTIMSKSFQAKVKVLPNVRKANDSSFTIQRAPRLAMLILALCVTDVHSSQANQGAVPWGVGGFRRLSEPSCPCPGTRHKLEWHVIKPPLGKNGLRMEWPKNDKTPIVCDMCRLKFPKDTMMYGCRACNWDACRRCYEDKMKTVPWGLSEPPSKTMSRFMSCPCPGTKHKLEWSKTPIGCDMCPRRCSTDTLMFYGCRECDWDACKSCYNKYKYRLCFEKAQASPGPAFSTRSDRLAAKYMSNMNKMRGPRLTGPAKTRQTCGPRPDRLETKFMPLTGPAKTRRICGPRPDRLETKFMPLTGPAKTRQTCGPRPDRLET